jgi:hypothetical protein
MKRLHHGQPNVEEMSMDDEEEENIFRGTSCVDVK